MKLTGLRLTSHADTTTGGLSQIVEELRQPQLGRVIVLEGGRTERLQLVQALARQLGYRLDLGAIVSKYIGETEKNLDALFAMANELNSILFFDEADSLFGSRTDVHSSHARYQSNMFSQFLSTHGLLVLGVERRDSLRADVLQRCKVYIARDHWPPR